MVSKLHLDSEKITFNTHYKIYKEPMTEIFPVISFQVFGTPSLILNQTLYQII